MKMIALMLFQNLLFFADSNYSSLVKPRHYVYFIFILSRRSTFYKRDIMYTGILIKTSTAFILILNGKRIHLYKKM